MPHGAAPPRKGKEIQITTAKLLVGDRPPVEGAGLAESTRARPAPQLAALAKAVGRRPPKVLADRAVPYSLLSAALFTLTPARGRKPVEVHLAARAAEDAPEGEYTTFRLALFESPGGLAPAPPCKVVVRAKKVTGGLSRKARKKAVAKAVAGLKPVLAACYAEQRLDPQKGKLGLLLTVDGAGVVTEVTVSKGDEFDGKGATACVTDLLKTLALPEGKDGAPSEVQVNLAYRVSKPKRARTMDAAGADDVVLKVGPTETTLIVGEAPPLTFPAPPDPLQQKALAAKMMGIYAGLADDFRLIIVPDPALTYAQLVATVSTLFSLADRDGEALYGGFTYLAPADDPLAE